MRKTSTCDQEQSTNNCMHHALHSIHTLAMATGDFCAENAAYSTVKARRLTPSPANTVTTDRIESGTQDSNAGLPGRSICLQHRVQ